MEPFSFDKLPEVIRQLFEKVEQIEFFLANLELKETNEKEWLDISEAADFLKVSVPALYSKVSRREIPVSKPGKRLYFNKTELKEWIRLGKKKTIYEIHHEANSRSRKRI